MGLEQNKTLIRGWITEGWNKHNTDVVDAYYARDVVQHDAQSPFPVNDSEAMKAYVGSFMNALPDLRFTIEDLLADQDKVLWRFVASGTQTQPLGPLPPSGRFAEVTGMVLFRIAHDKIVEVWVNVDFLGLFQQIGVIPAFA